MYRSRWLRRWVRALIGPALGIALTGYFSYNLVIGDRGLIAWRHLTEELQAEQAHLAALRAERKAVARNVAELSPEHLDPDLLDERVRATLNLVGPNELVIMKTAPASGH
jgi:cell division protein FtsB